MESKWSRMTSLVSVSLLLFCWYTFARAQVAPEVQSCPQAPIQYGSVGQWRVDTPEPADHDYKFDKLSAVIISDRQVKCVYNKTAPNRGGRPAPMALIFQSPAPIIAASGFIEGFIGNSDQLMPVFMCISETAKCKFKIQPLSDNVTNSPF